jgi:hypothetical protein
MAGTDFLLHMSDITIQHIGNVIILAKKNEQDFWMRKEYEWVRVEWELKGPMQPGMHVSLSAGNIKTSPTLLECLRATLLCRALQETYWSIAPVKSITESCLSHGRHVAESDVDQVDKDQMISTSQVVRIAMTLTARNNDKHDSTSCTLCEDNSVKEDISMY